MAQLFQYCPRCGAPDFSAVRPNLLACARCGFHYYLNPVISATAIVADPAGRLLLIRRAKAPAPGKLAFPGGFIDFGETAEQAVRRELQEELGLEILAQQYLTSHPNNYLYREVEYRVLDLFFTARVRAYEIRAEAAEVADYHWVAPEAIDPAELAFDSVRAALAACLGHPQSGKKTSL